MSAHNHLYESLTADPILVDASVPAIDRDLAVLLVETTAAETRTLNPPERVGQLLTVILDVDGGDLTLAQDGGAGFNVDGHGVVITDAGGYATLIGVSAGGVLRWSVVASDGATVS